MIRIEITIAAACLAALIAFPALSEAQKNPEPPTEAPDPTPEPPRYSPPSDGSSGDPQPKFSQPGQMPCCTRDGAILYHAPLGLGRERTRAYCAALDVATIPACKTWGMK